MSARTMNQLIASVIKGDESPETSTPEVGRVENPPRVEATGSEDAEKVASVLEFIAQRGVESFLVKEATRASEAPDTGTNAHQNLKGTSGHQHLSTTHAPPMKQPPGGKPEDNSKTRPGGGGSVDTKGKQQGTHHPALASNEAAIAASPTIKEKEVAPALGAVLKAAGPESNHTKMKKTASEHDLGQIRAELARRVSSVGRAS